jgi:formate hydrogenlyase subunit 6/NADH:ubiquinone oxidoreductase subunit I
MMGERPNFIIRVFRPFYHVARHLLYPPVTHKYPFERIKGFPRTRGYITLNIDTCIGCGACGYVCPDQAIKFFPVEGKPFTYPAFDFGKCSFCGLCVETCPTDSLHFTDIVELAGEDYKELVYMPDELREKDIKEILPEMEYELKTTITRDGPRYLRRKVR